MRVVMVIACRSGTALPWRDAMDNGNVVLGASNGAHPDGDDDIVHGPGMVYGRDVSDFLVAHRGVDVAAVNLGGDGRPGGRADLGHRHTRCRASDREDGGTTSGSLLTRKTATDAIRRMNRPPVAT